jgi:hypothetical protein
MYPQYNNNMLIKIFRFTGDADNSAQLPSGLVIYFSFICKDHIKNYRLHTFILTTDLINQGNEILLETHR